MVLILREGHRMGVVQVGVQVVVGVRVVVRPQVQVQVLPEYRYGAGVGARANTKEPPHLWCRGICPGPAHVTRCVKWGWC